MAEPTDEQLRDYAAKLPQIYKDILTAFPEINPERQVGEFLVGDSILMHVVEKSESYDVAYRIFDLQRAVAKLGLQDFLFFYDYKRGERPLASALMENFIDLGELRIMPTTLGERLIEILSQTKAIPSTVPELPTLSWSSR